MFDNAAYHRALVAHIVAIIVVFIAVLGVVLELGRARRSKTAAGMAAHARRGALLVWATVLVCAIALVPAVYMVPKKWSWQQGWVRVGLAAGVLLVLVLAAVLGPRLAALARLATREGIAAPSPQLRRRATHPVTWAAAQIVSTLYTSDVLLMLFKPRPAIAYSIFVAALFLGVVATLPALARYRRLRGAATGH